MKVKATRKHEKGEKKKIVYVFFVGPDLMMPFESLNVNIHLINHRFILFLHVKQFQL